jgi:glutamate/aspartate transport system permease protein
MNYNWNWLVFWEMAPDGMSTYLHTLLAGLCWTLAVSLAAWVIALAAGLAVGVLRTYGRPWLARLCAGYVQLFRNIPLLVQMFLWYYVFPELIPADWGAAIKGMDPAWSAFGTAVVCLGLFTSARIAEQIRAGIAALPRGQDMAATALGLRKWQRYRYVLLPMTARVIMPPLTSEALNLIKNSSVAFTIGLMEVTGAARSMQEFSAQIFESFFAATMLYVAVNLAVVALMRWVEKRISVPGYLGG